jgi:hypothetical protein
MNCSEEIVAEARDANTTEDARDRSRAGTRVRRRTKRTRNSSPGEAIATTSLFAAPYDEAERSPSLQAGLAVETICPALRLLDRLDPLRGA